MKKLGVVVIACALQSGCAEDEHIAAMNHPYENIPLALPAVHDIVIPSKTPSGEDMVVGHYETPGMSYPVYTDP